MKSDEIIIVSGLPRSGTSLLMQMLEAGGATLLTDENRLPDEDNPKGYLEFELVKNLRSNKEWLPLAKGNVVKVIHALLPDLPSNYQYKIIFIHRNVEEVVASQTKMLQRAGRTGANMPADKLSALFTAERNRITNWVSEQNNMSLMECDYRDILENPVVNAQSISNFLQIKLDTKLMAGVIDLSLYRNKI